MFTINHREHCQTVLKVMGFIYLNINCYINTDLLEVCYIISCTYKKKKLFFMYNQNSINIDFFILILYIFNFNTPLI